MAFTEIDNSELFFQAVQWTGNGSARDITLPGSENMQPDMVWTFQRSGSENNHVFDSVRGGQKRLYSNNTAAETTNSNTLDEFQTDGFGIGGDDHGVNHNTSTYVAHCWKAGTTSGITTNGSTTITPSPYSFSALAGISIVKYAGNATSGAKVAHGMGKVPKFIITKRQDEGAESWTTYHVGLGNTKFTEVNGSGTPGTATNRWNDTDPDTVNFTLGNEGSVNASSQPLMAWCFANVAGFAKYGTYKGNNKDPEGTFVYLGFAPQVVVCRRVDSGDNWKVVTRKVEAHNPMDQSVKWDNAAAEATESDHEIDLLCNGFKLRENNAAFNASGDYIYCAWAKSPIVNSKNVPNNAT